MPSNSPDDFKYSNNNTWSIVEIHSRFTIYEICKNWMPSNTPSLWGSSRNGTSCPTTFCEMISGWTLIDYVIYCPLRQTFYVVFQSHFCVYVWFHHFIQMMLVPSVKKNIHKILIQLNQLLQLLINISCP